MKPILKIVLFEVNQDVARLDGAKKDAKCTLENAICISPKTKSRPLMTE